MHWLACAQTYCIYDMNTDTHTKTQLWGKAPFHWQKDDFFIPLLLHSTITCFQLYVCMKESFIGYILRATKWHYCCNNTVGLIVCYMIIVGRCYYSGSVRADVIDSCAIASLQAHSFMCFFHSPTTSICVMQPSPKVMVDCLLAIWTWLIKNKTKHAFHFWGRKQKETCILR